MTDTTGAGEARPAPQLSVLAQYVKDLSFENPSLTRGDSQTQPNLDVQVDVAATRLADKDYEVILNINASAKAGEEALFVFEMVYAGVFRIENVPDEALQPTLYVECPRLLFPFARRVLADVTKEGGFPPLYLDPVDFMRLYVKQVREAGAGQPAGAPSVN